MKLAYSNISASTGAHIAGICRVTIIPVEWLTKRVNIDFITGQVAEPLVININKELIELDFVEETFEFEEKPKTAPAGDYYEITFGGIINTLTPEILQTLETLRKHELVALLTDAQGRKRLIGNNDEGIIMKTGNKQDNKNGGTLSVTIDFSLQSQYPSPFYPF